MLCPVRSSHRNLTGSTRIPAERALAQVCGFSPPPAGPGAAPTSLAGLSPIPGRAALEGRPVPGPARCPSRWDGLRHSPDRSKRLAKSLTCLFIFLKYVYSSHLFPCQTLAVSVVLLRFGRVFVVRKM